MFLYVDSVYAMLSYMADSFSLNIKQADLTVRK